MDKMRGGGGQKMSVFVHAQGIKTVYSEVPNKSVTFFILFWDFFLPTWPY